MRSPLTEIYGESHRLCKLKYTKLHDRPIGNLFLQTLEKYINHHHIFISESVHWCLPSPHFKNTVVFHWSGSTTAVNIVTVLSIIYLFTSESKWQKEKALLCPSSLPDKKIKPLPYGRLWARKGSSLVRDPNTRHLVVCISLSLFMSF